MLTMESKSVQAPANITSALMLTIAVLAPMPIDLVESASAPPSNSVLILQMKRSGKKFVDSLSIQSGLNRNIDDAFCRKSKRQMSSVSSKHERADCGKALSSLLIVMLKGSSTKMS